MKYQIIFTTQNNGVWAQHETLEKAQHHLNMLLGMNSSHNVTWKILHEGKVAKSNEVVKSNGGVAQR